MAGYDSGVLEPGDGYDSRFRAVLIAADPDDADRASEALRLAGIGIASRSDFADAPGVLASQTMIDLIAIEAAAADDDEIGPVLARADALAQASGKAVVLSVAESQIDAAIANLLCSNVQVLCAPNGVERIAAYLLAKVRSTDGVNDNSREDGETAQLLRLSEEVARIAEALARLTRREDSSAYDSNVSEPPSDYRGDDGEAFDASPAEIRAVIRSRRLRAQFFNADLFADPAWDMLLDLYAAGLEKRRVSVSSLCIAAAVPPTTALRWIGALHDAGLFERQADPNDRRRAYIALSAKGIHGMRSYIAAVKRQGLGLV